MFLINLGNFLTNSELGTQLLKSGVDFMNMSACQQNTIYCRSDLGVKS